MFQDISLVKPTSSNEVQFTDVSNMANKAILIELFRAAPSPLITKTLINTTQHKPCTVRKSIDYLVEQNLVEEINNPIDKRTKYYTLSMKGINQFNEFLAQLSTNN